MVVSNKPTNLLHLIYPMLHMSMGKKLKNQGQRGNRVNILGRRGKETRRRKGVRFHHHEQGSNK
ncbi:hypothetical protein O9G_001453 [Rozella allomycis CSF55]|uniref:Uncharacterized protein n=1 Tax=Rozella allomycis (strain CSF55) TaxID=988480 RepID=A0A075AQJ5_ROZAC|nr:hypothetical protein O9G_001453 [Rozella allomycis CSF55]|eukprot:EPZ30980.1 hypothetical protein O9G_001453 [Rozella allomycis CSF55]